MRVSEYRSLLLHMEWADSLVWQAALTVPSTATDERLRQCFRHYQATQWAYLKLFQHAPLDVPDLARVPDLLSLGRWARGFYRALALYVATLDEAVLGQHVEFPWVAQVVETLGSAGPATVGESILHLALHTAHHRGQVATRLREAGCEPPMIDFMAWVWMRRPKAQWDGLVSNRGHR